jgi:autotransporter-associated beta strand protein
MNLNGFTLTKAGPGKLILNGVNITGPGNITLNQGTLQLMDVYTGGSQQATTLAASGNLTINSGASVLTYRWSPSLTVAMPIVLNGGTLGSGWPGPNGATIASPISVQTNSTLNFNGGYGTVTLSGNISGSGGLVITGDTDTRTFTGTNSYAWTTIKAGTLRIGNGGGSGTLGLGNVTNNAALTFNRTNYLAVSNHIFGAGTLTQAGIGTVALFGPNSYSGKTAVANGTLQVNGSLGTSTVTMTNATLAGVGTINGAVIVQDGGKLAPGTNGVGTLATGPETWNGGGYYLFELNSPTSSAGWDRLNITGTLDVQATPTSLFTIKLVSLTTSNTPGLLAGFDKTKTNTWTIASTSGGVQNFAVAKFALDASGFRNDFSGGTFSIALQGTAIVVVYQPPPSPTFTNPAELGGGTFQFRLANSTVTNYTVLASTNLINWRTLNAPLRFSNGIYQFTDPSFTNAPWGFYRLRWP